MNEQIIYTNVLFDIYMMCREKIYELKANEVRNRTYRAFKRANLITENSPEENGG